jgi:hypothetical protein
MVILWLAAPSPSMMRPALLNLQQKHVFLYIVSSLLPTTITVSNLKIHGAAVATEKGVTVGIWSNFGLPLHRHP